MRHPILTLAALLAPSLVLAQAPAPAAPPQAPAPSGAPVPAPQVAPAAEVKNVEFLVGDWIHEENWAQAAVGTAGRGKGVSRGQWILGEHVLQITYKANTSMLGTVEARGFLRYDSEKKVYVFDWMTSRGTAFHMEGSLEGRALVFQADRIVAGQVRKEKLTLAPQEDGSVVEKIELVGADGTLVPAMEAKITAKPKADAPKQ